jgi:hypothetical protein
MATTSAPSPPPLVFGIYPGGHCAKKPRIPDDPVRIGAALAQLQGGPGRPFRVRGYLVYTDGATAGGDPDVLLRQAGLDGRSLSEGRRLDLVLAYQSTSGDVPGYTAFIRHAIRQLHPLLDTVQITEEPNAVNNVGYVDGDMPKVREALVAGVLAAREEVARAEGRRIQVGFNVVPSFDEANDFAPTLARLGGPRWAAAVDYVGLDCFPDVWVSPPASIGIGQAVVHLLTWLRDKLLPAAGLPASLPIVIAENGWPTGPERPPERQVQVLEEVIRAVSDSRGRFNVQAYTLFDLRDADSGDPDLFSQFGILRGDYTPKPAFDLYRRLVAELGSPPG